MIEITEKSGHSDASHLNHVACARGCEHFKATNYYMAADQFVESLEYWPEDPQAWMALGNCFDEIGKPKKAEYCFRRSVELLPGKDKLRLKVQYNLANSIFDQDRFDEAINLYRMIPGNHPIGDRAQKNLMLAVDLQQKQESGEGDLAQPAAAVDLKSE